MPPSDQEPRYQLVDSNGNVVGSLFGDGSGNVVIADETDTQTTFGTDGITTPALEAADGSIAGFPFARALGQSSTETEEVADNQAVSANSWGTVFDVTDPVSTITGNIYGPIPSNLRVTYDDGSTETFGRGPGLNASGEVNDGSTVFGVLPVPPLDNITKLEFYNDAGTEKNYGYFVITT